MSEKVFTPIIACEWQDHEDGCCQYPDAPTPECHVDACPRLDPRVAKGFKDYTKDVVYPPGADVMPRVVERFVRCPGPLFEKLFEYAMDLRAEWEWKKDEQRRGHDKTYAALVSDIKTALKIVEGT